MKIHGLVGEKFDYRADGRVARKVRWDLLRLPKRG